MTHVKICGVRRVEHARIAADAGAQFVGLVFAPSRRRIDPDAARALVARTRVTSAVQFVGVFVNETPAEINRIARACMLDFAQLSGAEPDSMVDELDVPAIKVFHVPEAGIDADLASRVERSRAQLVLLDTASTGSYGGTGQAFRWSACHRIERPFLLAGGLAPGNVADAIRAMSPWGVDVSSGVESGGEKDGSKIAQFVASVQSVTV